MVRSIRATLAERASDWS